MRSLTALVGFEMIMIFQSPLPGVNRYARELIMCVCEELVFSCNFYRATCEAYARSCCRHLSVRPSVCLSV